MPRDKSIWLFIPEPIPSSIPQREREKPQLNGVGGDPIEFNSVTLREEIAKVHIRVLRGVPTELVSLHQRDKGRVQLKVVDLNRRVHYGGGDTHRLRHSIIPQNSIILHRYCRICLLLSSRAALLASSCFNFNIQRKQVVIPLTAPVHTKQQLYQA